MPPTNVLSRIRNSISEAGLAHTLQRVAKKIYRRIVPIRIPTHPFDLQHGVETSGLLGKPDLISGHAHDTFTTAYWGTAPSFFRHALRRWAELLSETPHTPTEYVFLDIGCGKGRALLLASELPFRKIIGIELNPGLVDVARKNLAIWRESDHPCNDLTVMHADALAVELPESPVLIYLFNPFDAPLVQLLLDRLSSFAQTRANPIDLIYARPEHAQLFDLYPSMELLCNVEEQLTSEETAVDAFATRTLDFCIYRLYPRAEKRP